MDSQTEQTESQTDEHAALIKNISLLKEENRLIKERISFLEENIQLLKECIAESVHSLSLLKYSLMQWGTDQHVVVWCLNNCKNIMTDNNISEFLHIITSARLEYQAIFYKIIPVTINHYFYDKVNERGLEISYNILHDIEKKYKIECLEWIMKKHELTKENMLELYHRRGNKISEKIVDAPITALMYQIINESSHKFKKLYQIFPITLDMYCCNFLYEEKKLNILHNKISEYYLIKNDMIDSMEYITEYHNLSSIEFTELFKKNLNTDKINVMLEYKNSFLRLDKLFNLEGEFINKKEIRLDGVHRYYHCYEYIFCKKIE